MGETLAGIAYHQQALKLLGIEGRHLDYAVIYDNLASCYLDLDKTDEALLHSDLALQQMKIINTDNNVVDTSQIINHSHKLELFNMIMERVRILGRINNKKDKEQWLMYGQLVLNSMTYQIGDNTGQMSFRRKGRELFDQLVDLYADKSENAKMLDAIEQSKSFIIKAKWQNNNFNTPEQKLLKKKISELEIEIFETEVKRDSLLTELIALRSKLISSSKGNEIFPPDDQLINDVRNRHKKSDVIIYYLSKVKGYMCHISEANTQFYELPGSDSLAQLIRTFYLACSDKTFPNRITIMEEYGNVLHEILIARLSLKQEKLIIIPDGILYQLPFSALKNQQGKHLASDKVITQSTSLRHLLYASNTNNNKMGFILPEFAEEDKLHHASLDLASAQYIFDITPIDYNDPAAFHDKVAELGAIHFATHGVVNEDLPEYSYLSMGQKKLFLKEVWNSDWALDLVVLGACKSGFGKIFEREGNLSFGEAFLAAGCPNVVISKWEVDDYSTSELLTNFYKYYDSSIGPAEALSSSIKLYLKSTNDLLKDPYYWAAWVAYEGKPTPETRKTNYFWTFLIFIFIIVVFIIVYNKNLIHAK